MKKDQQIAALDDAFKAYMTELFRSLVLRLIDSKDKPAPGAEGFKSGLARAVDAYEIARTEIEAQT